MQNTITFKTAQEYLDDVEQLFNNELSNCIPKKQLKLIQNDLNIPLSNIKNHLYDFSYYHDNADLIIQKQFITDQLTANQQYQLDKELFSHILSQYIILPQMNIDKIYTKWANLINVLYTDNLFRLEQKIQERLTKITNQNIILFYNGKNETIATISKDGIFSFKIEPNDENTKDFLKIVQTLGVEVKQINYSEI